MNYFLILEMSSFLHSFKRCECICHKQIGIMHVIPCCLGGFVCDSPDKLSEIKQSSICDKKESKNGKHKYRQEKLERKKSKVKELYNDGNYDEAIKMANKVLNDSDYETSDSEIESMLDSIEKYRKKSINKNDDQQQRTV